MLPRSGLIYVDRYYLTTDRICSMGSCASALQHSCGSCIGCHVALPGRRPVGGCICILSHKRCTAKTCESTTSKAEHCQGDARRAHSPS